MPIALTKPQTRRSASHYEVKKGEFLMIGDKMYQLLVNNHNLNQCLSHKQSNASIHPSSWITSSTLSNGKYSKVEFGEDLKMKQYGVKSQFASPTNKNKWVNSFVDVVDSSQFDRFNRGNLTLKMDMIEVNRAKLNQTRKCITQWQCLTCDQTDSNKDDHKRMKPTLCIQSKTCMHVQVQHACICSLEHMEWLKFP